MLLSTITSAEEGSTTDTSASERPELRVKMPKGLELLPKDERGRKVIFRPNQQYRCYTIGEYAQVADFIVDYRWFFSYSQKLELKLQKKQVEIGRLEEINAEHKDRIEELEHDVRFNAALFDQEHALRLSEGVMRTKRERLFWIVGGSLLVANVVLGIGLAAK
jgi:hypothetical protein